MCMSMNCRWIALSTVLAAPLGCCHATKSANEQPHPRDNVFEIVSIGGQLALKKMLPIGSSQSEIEQLELKKIQQAIDSSLVPHASPEMRDRLVSIKSIMGRVDRDGEVFLRSADNFADFVTASADLTLIAGAVYSDNLEVQLQIPSALLMTVSNLESLRGIGVSRDVGPDMARYTSEAIRVARKTVDRFPNAGRAYGQLAFVQSLTGGDKKEIQKLFKRCIDLDGQAEFCREGYRSITQEGAK